VNKNRISSGFPPFIHKFYTYNKPFFANLPEGDAYG